MAGTLGEIQPFRYRGYVYDVETRLYYLRSRYDRPEWGRFVNADDVINDNLFSYCCCAPTVYIDPNGKSYEPYETVVYNPQGDTVNMLTKGNPSFPNRRENEWYTINNDTAVRVIYDVSGLYVKVECATQNGTYTGWIAKEYVDVSMSHMTADEAFDRDTIIAPSADLQKDYYFPGNVANIQHYLNRFYYNQYGERYHLRANGKIDTETRRLIFEFQQFYHDNYDSSFSVDGYFGEKTGKALHRYIEDTLRSGN